MDSIIPTGMQKPVNETLPQAIQRIANELDPEKIIFFGSFAYGKPTSDSDVDLLVILDTNQSAKERSWAVSRLLLPRRFPVDILVKTPKEIKKCLSERRFFYQRNSRKGQGAL